ncbi:MAG: thiosulfate oxidation carrier complex protein SoxZ [Burkholderiales bacterium]|nr:thiosulfate oxidation carrier complex protein SoxZ [Burkholderiales bacterium]
MDARISVPSKVVRGEPFEVRLSIRHPMETGYRTDDVGRSIPRNVIRTLTCRYNGEVAFRAQLSSGIAANPYLRWFVTARDSGELVFEWVDDAGVRGSGRAAVNVV